MQQIAARFDRALGSLEAGPLRQLRRAPLYRTAPQGDPHQPDFVNTVVVARLARGWLPDGDTARRLVSWGKHLEAAAGRRRDAAAGGPRPLDVDLLLLGSLRLDLAATAEPAADLDVPAGAPWPGAVVVPHPRLLQRRFVLQPLHDLLPDLGLPASAGAVTTVAAALRQLVEGADPLRPATVQRVHRLTDTGDWWHAEPAAGITCGRDNIVPPS